MPVTCIEDLEEFKSALQKAGDKLVVVDFTATWCGPCKQMSPYFDELSTAHTTVVFLKVDVDDAADVAGECKINCMPTFHFYKNGEKVDEFSGANKEMLKQKLEAHK